MGQFQSFVCHKGQDLYFIQDDPCYDLLLLSISFLKPNSLQYASLLNEMGRYLHSQVPSHAGQHTLFQAGVQCYQQAISLFEMAGDVGNTGVVLCNICQCIRQPMKSSLIETPDQQTQQTLTVEDARWFYSLLHWINERVDDILASEGLGTIQQTVWIWREMLCRLSKSLQSVSCFWFGFCLIKRVSRLGLLEKRWGRWRRLRIFWTIARMYLILPEMKRNWCL